MENDRLRGWKDVQKMLPRIIHYGRIEGILPTKNTSVCYISFISKKKKKLEIIFLIKNFEIL